MLGFYPLGAAPVGGLSGQAFSLTSEAGAFVVAGQSPMFRRFDLDAEAGAFLLAGADAITSQTAFVVQAEPATFVMSGGNIEFSIRYRRRNLRAYARATVRLS